MAQGREPGVIVIADAWRIWARVRLDDDGITVRNVLRTYRIGWDQVCGFEDGSVRGGLGGQFWALRIALRDGRVITAEGTSCWRTAARPETLRVVGQAAGRHAVPSELTGLPPGTGPGMVTIADRGWWTRTRLRFDDDGITVRNVLRTYRIGWDQVRWFRDGQVERGWALSIVLHDGRVITPHATQVDARPGTLAAIRQAAGRHMIPAVLTGTPAWASQKPVSVGLHVDPGGKLGLRQWTGTEWSPFLEMDPGSSGPEGEKGPARVWSPLPEPEQQRQWDAAATEARRSEIIFARSLVVSAVAGAATVAYLGYELSQPKPHFRWAELLLSLLGMTLVFTVLGWYMRRESRKVDQAAKRAAELACAVDSTASPLDDRVDRPTTDAPTARQPIAAADPAARAVWISCLECGAGSAEATPVCGRCGALLPAPQPSLAGDPEEGAPAV
jgi:hypothetical protein